MKTNCLNCTKKRRKLLVHNTNDNFCSSNCKREYYFKIRRDLETLDKKIESLYLERINLNNYKKEVFGNEKSNT